MMGSLIGDREQTSPAAKVERRLVTCNSVAVENVLNGHHKNLTYLKSERTEMRELYNDAKLLNRDDELLNKYKFYRARAREVQSCFDKLEQKLEEYKEEHSGEVDQSKIKVPYTWIRASGFAMALVEIDRAQKQFQSSDLSAVKKPGITGLANNRNSCYMNACLQPLSALPQLRDYFLKNTFVKHINGVNPSGTKGRIACNYAALQLFLWSGRYNSIDPHRLLLVLSRHCSTFADNQQHDAQEFLVTLLDTLHEDVNRVIFPERGEQQNEGKSLEQAGRDALEMSHKFARSHIYWLFEGQAVSIIRCNKCSATSTKFDSFTQVTLDLLPDPNCTLEDCFRDHFRDEAMDGDSCWKCPTCNKLQEATKMMRLWKLPQVLIIHFKRFEQIGVQLRKMDSLVTFPLHQLSLDAYIHQSSDHKPKQYTLFAVTNHKGSLTRGHYTAMCRHPDLKRWFDFDDETLQEISEPEVVTPSAYILYYTSKSYGRSSSYQQQS